MQNKIERKLIIIRTSIYGIILNILLFIFKLLVGLTTKSISVVADAINNLSDAMSSVITIVGTKLALKPPDKDHPLGHGRIEYITTFIIAIVILYAGVNQFIDAITKIINKENANYTSSALLILLIAIFVKVFLSIYVKGVGIKINSKALIAQGEDAKMDVLLSSSVLVCALMNYFLNVNLEAILALLISMYIVKSGLYILFDAGNEIIGKRVSKDLSKSIKETLCSDERVHGAYDLFVVNFGPEKYVASAHIEVDDTMTAKEIDELTRDLQNKVLEKHNIILGTIGIYSTNTSGDIYSIMRDDIRKLATSHDGVLQIHGFYVNEEKKEICFDMVLDFKIENIDELKNHIIDDIRKKYSNYNVLISIDIDLSD